MCYIVVDAPVTARAKKSVVRSIRITKELDDVIRQDAEDAGVSSNALIASVLAKYAEWDRLADRFGFVTMARGGFRALLEEIEDERLLDLAENFAPSLSREVALHFFKKVNFETYYRLLMGVFRYGHLGEYYVEMGKDGDTLTIHHDLGRKWSLLLSRAIGQSFEAIANLSPEASIEESTFILSFPPGTLNGTQAPKG